MKSRPGKQSITFIFFIAALCILCCTFGWIYTILTDDSGSVNDTPTLESLSIEQIIAGTANAAQIQTQQAAPQEIIIEPTATIFIFKLQTEVANPTYIPPSATLFILATAPLNTPPASDGAVCSCSGDTLNCSDFSTQASAQSCFDYCQSQGMGDIHRLDSNNDGSACESLP